MNCRGTQNRLSAYLDGELRGDESLAVREHLRTCATCQQEERTLRSLKRLLCGVTTPEPSEGLADRLAQRIRQEAMVAPTPTSPERVWRPYVLAACLAAGSMAVTLALLNGFRDHSSSASGPSRATEAMAFEVRRDQAMAVGLDATMGTPITAMADHVAR